MGEREEVDQLWGRGKMGKLWKQIGGESSVGGMCVFVCFVVCRTVWGRISVAEVNGVSDGSVEERKGKCVWWERIE